MYSTEKLPSLVLRPEKYGTMSIWDLKSVPYREGVLFFKESFVLLSEVPILIPEAPLTVYQLGTSCFVLCREIVLFQRWFSIKCVYMSTFSLSFVGRFVLFQSVLYRRFHCISLIG